MGPCLIHAQRASSSQEDALTATCPKNKRSEKVERPSVPNLIHSQMIYFLCLCAGTTPGIFMWWTGTGGRMVTAGSGWSFIKIINGLRRGTFISGLMIWGADGKSARSWMYATLAHVFAFLCRLTAYIFFYVFRRHLCVTLLLILLVHAFIYTDEATSNGARITSHCSYGNDTATLPCA